MSLAIEALRQVNQTEGVEIDGVTLRDVDIKTALVIPQKDNGIEIQLRFQELATTEKATTWYSFAVESIMEDRWTTHCEGRIAANHHIPLSARKLDSPVDLSKLTQRVPGRRWYEAFNELALNTDQRSSLSTRSGQMVEIMMLRQMSRSPLKAVSWMENPVIFYILQPLTLVCNSSSYPSTLVSTKRWLVASCHCKCKR